MTVLDQPTHPSPHHELRVDVFQSRQRIRVETLFWQHRSPFLGSQEQLDELAREADVKAAGRAAQRAHDELIGYLKALRPRPSVFDVHRPAVRRLKVIVHVGLIPMLWAITTCQCGERWPCNSVKQHLRRHLGWTIDITHELKRVTRELPKPRTRLVRLVAVVRRAMSVTWGGFGGQKRPMLETWGHEAHQPRQPHQRGGGWEPAETRPMAGGRWTATR